MNLQLQNYALSNLSQINVILGKNGCGKSTLLRSIDAERRNHGYIRYLSPERGGALKYEGGIESQMQNPTWLSDTRRTNQNSNFREIAVSQFRRLETYVLRTIEKDAAVRATEFTFDTTVELINELLENIQLRRGENEAFEVIDRRSQQRLNVGQLSSGESELISLAIEVLSFAYIVKQDQYSNTENWLLFDEPDVHLHPDLQYRLMNLLVNALRDKPCRVIISTHSTAILSALSDITPVYVAFMASRQNRLPFEAVDEALKHILPIFGAHPLSNVFNEHPILLVEGEDDERIWQQAYRSSHGAIQIWPCVAGDIQSLQAHELKAQAIIRVVYDNAHAYSLRDRDTDQYPLEDLGPIVRSRLNCRASENLILSDDVLSLLDMNWQGLQRKLEEWIGKNADHPQIQAVIEFRNSGWDRRNTDLKPLRNILMMLAGSNKPWEVAVGQAIAKLKRPPVETGEFSLTDFLGPKIVDALNLRP